jgi:hypothetical protein
MQDRKNPFLEDPKEPQEQPVKTKPSDPGTDWDNVINGFNVTQEEIEKPDKIFKKKKMLIIGGFITALLVLSAGTFFGAMYAINSRNASLEKSTSATVAPTPSTIKPSATATSNGSLTNPASSVEEFKNVPDGTTNVKSDTNSLTFTNADKTSTVIQLKAISKITASSVECNLNDATASCFLGTGVVNDKTVQLYAFKGAKSNAILYSKTDPKTIANNGAALAFTQTISYKGKNQNALYVLTKNQNGIMVTSDDSSTIDTIASDTTNHFVVTESN